MRYVMCCPLGVGNIVAFETFFVLLRRFTAVALREPLRYGGRVGWFDSGQ
jgi:hypothetical protein